jgi:hypothetical protein
MWVVVVVAGCAVYFTAGEDSLASLDIGTAQASPLGLSYSTRAISG